LNKKGEGVKKGIGRGGKSSYVKSIQLSTAFR
jgi:hypothetical protein